MIYHSSAGATYYYCCFTHKIIISTPNIKLEHSHISFVFVCRRFVICDL